MCLFTGCGMVIWISFFEAVTNVGFGPNLLPVYGILIIKNFIFAIPLNLLIVSPLIRMIFFKIFPPITKEEEPQVLEESLQM